ncbi:MAG: hypothetical protein QM802_19945 [Agriterribacter sp.]
MKIIYTLPGIETPHGGYRIVMEHLTRLQALGHEVALFVESNKTNCSWYPHTFPIISTKHDFKYYDCIVIGSPHSIWLQDSIKSYQKCFLFMQMDERKFRTNDPFWDRLCRLFYTSKFPIIHGSLWGEEICRSLGRTGPMHYIGNGVNFDHFPIEHSEKDGLVILLEGPFNKNPAKDVDQLALKVAQQLKREIPRLYVLAYGFDLTKNLSGIDEYIARPSLQEMNRFYRQASILVKATKYDARALSPIEAMTKGTVTSRAIISGDDDLINGYNSLRCDYDFDTLYQYSKSLLEHPAQRNILSENCIKYVQENCNWDKIIDQLNSILCA